jgi:hypothetical protein
MKPLPEIRSLGRPPEQHADRIIAKMLQLLSERHAHVTQTIVTVLSAARDGTPRGQRKMEARIRAAGALQTYLKPGTRGRYKLLICTLTGWDPIRDAEIGVGDPIPPKPWLVVWMTVLDGRSGRMRGRRAALITHHAFSRAAQRCGVRTVDDLLLTAATIGGSVAWHAVKTNNALPPDRRLPLGDGQGTLVLRKDEEDDCLVVVTVLEP